MNPAKLLFGRKQENESDVIIHNVKETLKIVKTGAA